MLGSSMTAPIIRALTQLPGISMLAMSRGGLVFLLHESEAEECNVTCDYWEKMRTF